MKAIVSLCLALALAGCLTTTKPVFDETNSKPVGEIPQFMEYVRASEAFEGTANSPRELIGKGARGAVVDGILVVQEADSDIKEWGYYALMVMGDRPLKCMIWADRDFEKRATESGVTADVQEDKDSTRDDGPVPVIADGPIRALKAWVRDQFANQRLACIAEKRRSP